MEPITVTFSWLDYTLFAVLLVFGILIGIYYGCFGSKQSTTKEYLYGGKNMNIFPIAMSLTVSYISGIFVLGIPAEVYLYGTQYWICLISLIIVSLVVMYVYLPVFYKLQLDSCYEYFELRFSRSVRSLASLLCLITIFIQMPIVIYIPSLVVNQVTGIELYKICLVVCLVCIFYTSIGGLKAVVVSDTLQFAITLITLAVVLIIGTISTGGFAAVWETAASNDRIEFFNMNLDPTERTTFWGIVVGLTSTWICSVGLSPSSVQRFLALPSYEAARKSLFLYSVGSIITKSLICYFGILMFAKFVDCDPFTAGLIKYSDQLLPYYFFSVAGNLPGLSGMFFAGLFSSSFSGMSNCLNSFSGVVYQDYIMHIMPKTTSEKTASNIMKIVGGISGLAAVALVLLIEKLGGVYQVTLSLNGITSGPILGLFTLAALFPSANTKGALTGTIISTILMSVLVGGNLYYNMQGRIQSPFKPLFIDGCGFNIRESEGGSRISELSDPLSEEPFALFRISFYFFAIFGAALMLIIGLSVSWLTKDKNGTAVNRDLLSPCIYWLLPRQTEGDASAKPETNEVALTNVLDCMKST